MSELENAFKDVADAIREKDGTSSTMTPLQMADRIQALPTGDKYEMTLNCMVGEVDVDGVLNKGSGALSSSSILGIADRVLQYAFFHNTGLTTVSLPNLTTIGEEGMSGTFNGCTSLTSIDLSSLTSVGPTGMYNAFRNCTSLTSVDLSRLESIPNTWAMRFAFGGCTSLTNVDLSSLSSATGASMSGTFNGCTSLQEVKFNNATAIPAITSNTFQNTNSTFKIIVPDALYSQWRTATNWSAYANQIVKVSEYTPAS